MRITQQRYQPILAKLSILPTMIPVVWLLLAGWLVLYATRWGIGTSPDSVVYLGTADNLLRGQGLSIPFGDPPDRHLTFYPPLYPLFLAAGGLLLGEPLTESTRWLHSGLFITNLIVGWMLLKRMMFNQHAWLPAIFLFPLATSSTLLTLHLMAWSEPLFLLTGFSGLLLIAQGLVRGQKSLVFTGGILLGLATLTRYSGLAFIAAAMLSTFIFIPGKLAERIGNAHRVGVPGLIIFVALAVYTLLLRGTVANRSVEFHPFTRIHFNQALDTISGWVMIPLTLPGIMKLGLLGVVAGLCLLILFGNRNRIQPLGWLLVRFLLVFALVYPAFLVASISFVDANTPLDDRILSPLFVTFWLLLATAISCSVPERIARKYVFMVVLVFALIQFMGATWINIGTTIRSNHMDGIGFLNKSWRESPLIAHIRSLPDDHIVYTNSPEAVYLLTNRTAAPLPRKFDLTRQKPNLNFAGDMERLRNNLNQENATLAYFTIVRSPALPTFEEITTSFVPARVTRFDAIDGYFLQILIDP